MAIQTGTYQIGGQTYDIDPHFASLLYSPLEIKDLSQGFQQFQQPTFTPQEAHPTTPVADSGYLDKDTASGGDNDMRSIGIDPNSGMEMRKDLNYDNPAWWGGYDPQLSTSQLMKDYAPMAMQFAKNPLGTTIRAMSLDPMKDKSLQKAIEDYLGQVNPEMTIDQFMEQYNAVINANWESKVNAEDTIRGLAMKEDPRYSAAFESATTNNRMRPDQFARYVEGVNMYNAENPFGQFGNFDPVNHRAVELGMSPEYALTPLANTLMQYGVFAPPNLVKDAVGREQQRQQERAVREAAYDSIVQEYGYANWDDFANSVRNGSNNDRGTTTVDARDTISGRTQGAFEQGRGANSGMGGGGNSGGDGASSGGHGGSDGRGGDSSRGGDNNHGGGRHD